MGRIAAGVALVTAGLLCAPLAFRQVRHWLATSRGPELTARQRLDVHKTEGLHALIARVRRGPLLPENADALVTVDQRLVQSLLSTLVPSDHRIDRFRVQLVGATVAFEDGFALVRLDARASLAEASDVFAELTVFGDLRICGAPPGTNALQAHVKVIAVDVRNLGLLGTAGDRMASELGRARLEQFASLVSPLEIPVRQSITLAIPSLAAHSVQIENAEVPVYFRVLEITAFHGKLWISMDASTQRDAASEPVLPTPAPAAPPREWSAALEGAHRRSHARLEALLAADDLVREATTAHGDVVFAVRSDFAKDVIAEVVARYFDRVVVDLREIAVARQGSVEKDTPLGHMRVGDWTADLQVERASGVLRAGRPEVRFQRDNRVAIALPLRLEEGDGRARLHFAWDSRGLANLVCRDFEAHENIRGSVRAEEYLVDGSLTLEATPDALSVRPDFPDRFRIKLDLNPASWQDVRSRLEQEDRVLRCGLPLDADRTLSQLRELTEHGFDVRLPEKLFRTVRLPAQIASSVQIGGYELGVEVSQQSLRLTPEVVWYGASANVTLPPDLLAEAGPERTGQDGRGAGIAVAGEPAGGA